MIGVVSLVQANSLQRQNNQLQQSGLNSRLEESMIGIDRHFVTYSVLRRYFFAINGRQTPAPRNGWRAAKAEATAELIIDFADDVASYLRTGMMSHHDIERWRAIVGAYFNESPVLRLMWSQDAGAYDDVTACVMDAPPQDAIGAWNWRTDTPRHGWHAGCDGVH
jgi:hypothetical protein